VGRPVRQWSVKRTPSTINHAAAARSPSVARHASSVRRAPSFRPEDISTPTFQSSTNSLLAAVPSASTLAEEPSSPPTPARSPRLPDDDRIQPTRVAPPPPTAQSTVASPFSASSEGLHKPVDKSAAVSSPPDSAVEAPRYGPTNQQGVSPFSLLPLRSGKPGASSSSASSAAGGPRSDDCGGMGAWRQQAAVRAPPRPRHALNKVVRAESLRQQQGSDHPGGSGSAVTPATVDHVPVHHHHSAAASVIASLRDRFEARRAASDVPGTSGTTPATQVVSAKPDIPPKPGVAAGTVDDGLVERRAKRLQRQPAFSEFDIVNASKLSTTEQSRVT